MLQWPSLAGTPHAPLPTGVAGLSRSDLTLQPQLAICLLTSEVSLPGMAFFGSEPFHPMPPTPPLKHPSDPACLVDHEGVPVNGQAVRFAARMLELDSLGHGGIKISSSLSHGYVTLKSRHICRPFLKAIAGATKEIDPADAHGEAIQTLHLILPGRQEPDHIWC